MKDEKETKAKLLISAKTEFMEKGYQGASLRNICKNAGVTTGALYFFFQDKEELFASLVQPVVEVIQKLMEAHMKQELLEVEEPTEKATKEASEKPVEELQDDENAIGDDVYAAGKIVHILYENYDSVQLLLLKSQGSKMAGCIEAFVSFAEQNYRALAKAQSEKWGVPLPDEYTIHWLAHMQIDAFVHLLTHEPDEEKAMAHLRDVIKYLVAGWYALFDAGNAKDIEAGSTGEEQKEKEKKETGKKKIKIEKEKLT